MKPVTGRTIGRNLFGVKPRPAWPRTALILLLTAAGITLLCGGPTKACFEPLPTFIVSVWVVPDPFEDFEFEAVIHDFETAGERQGPGCGMGFSYCLDEDRRPVACPEDFSITSVGPPIVIDVTTNAPLPGLSFRRSATVARGFFPPNTQGVPTTHGFFSAVTQDIPPRRPVDIKFRITTKPGTTFEKLKSDLQRFVVIASDEANQDETLTNTRRRVVRVGNVMLMPGGPSLTVPTLSQWGMIIMFLLLITSGIAFITRRGPLMLLSGVVGLQAQSVGRMSAPFFEPKVFRSALAISLGLLLVGLAVASRLFGRISITDMVGALACTLIVAYMLHLLIPTARQKR